MFNEKPRATGVRTVFEEVATEGGQAWNVIVQVRYGPDDWQTKYAARWSGYEVDLVATLAEDVTSSFFFGEEGDVGRAAVSVGKVARAHRRRHDRVG